VKQGGEEQCVKLILMNVSLRHAVYMEHVRTKMAIFLVFVKMDGQVVNVTNKSTLVIVHLAITMPRVLITEMDLNVNVRLIGKEHIATKILTNVNFIHVKTMAFVLI
jgi:hypothetical protein